MLARQRQALILDRVRRLGAIRVTDLVEELGVSDMTIRRDLDVLSAAGQLDKVYGGATALATPSTEEPGFAAKSARQTKEKDAIAVQARALVRPGMAVGVAAGTTTWTLATKLIDIPGLTVITNSIRVADTLSSTARTDQTVVLTGGTRTPSDALIGPIADRALASLHLDIVFMGAHGMAPESGFTTPNLGECETDRAFLAAARRKVFLVDSHKWNVLGISTIAAFSEVDVVITDSGISTAARAVLRDGVGELKITQKQG
jgi:DeoR/GlpR family transcriptional regulator of sugar metabolism